MAWVTLSETDLLGTLSDPEVTAFKSAAVRGTEGDPAGAILDAVNLARGYISNRFRLGAAGTIPEKLKSCVLDIAAMSFMSRAGGYVIDPKGVRAEAARGAMQVLRDVADGRFAVESPTTADSETVGTPQPSINDGDRERQFGSGYDSEGSLVEDGA